jgi:glycosyltransferase involved in cell wall biosynthesis
VGPAVRPVVLPALLRADRKGLGGIESYAIELEKRLRERGRPVTILGHGSEQGDGFLSVLDRDDAKGRHFAWALYKNRKRWRFPPETVIHVQRPDHVAAFAAGPWPIVLTFHGRHQKTVAARTGPVGGWIYRAVEKRACRRADAVVFVSRADMTDVTGADPRLASRAAMIPVGVDRNLFCAGERVAARRRLDLPSGAKGIGYAGRIEVEKNLPSLIKAIERIPEIELWIAGAGREEAACRRAAGPRVRFLGPLPREAMPDFFAAADALALASRHEGLPTVVLEALSCGRPVLATPVGDLPSLLAHGGGVVAAGFDPESLAEGIRRLLPMLDGAREEALRSMTEAFDWSAITDRLSDVYDEAAARRSAAGS